MSKQKRCIECEFWLEEGFNVNGDCRRNPPIPSVKIEKQGSNSWESENYRIFPRTGPNDFCGEFKEK